LRKQPAAIAAIVLAGGWLEVYISPPSGDMKDFDGKQACGRIIDQKLSVDILIRLLESNAGHPAVDDSSMRLKGLRLF